LETRRQGRFGAFQLFIEVFYIEGIRHGKAVPELVILETSVILDERQCTIMDKRMISTDPDHPVEPADQLRHVNIRPIGQGIGKKTIVRIGENGRTGTE